MTTTDTARDFLVRRDDLHATRVRRHRAADHLADGDVLMTVDRFALTANNVTYATFGDAMSYWDFFPTHEDGWGLVPAWGFGTVTISRCRGVAAGDRFYGYFPMSTHLVVTPQRVKASGFVDGSPHRAKLHALYNQYTRNASDALYDAAREDVQLLMRPLFITSFVIDDFLADQGFFGAEAVIVSSASSKTAYGLAWSLGDRHVGQRRPAGPEVIGLTSARNVAFVEGLGCYDRVLTYDAVASLPSGRPVVYIDFAGDRVLRAAVHRHVGDAMRYSGAVGSSHRDAEREAGDSDGLPGAKPVFFFAPTQIRKRVDEWGADGFQQRFAAAWRRFTDRVVAPDRPWMRIHVAEGPAAVEATYRALLDGKADPADGFVVSMIGG